MNENRGALTTLFGFINAPFLRSSQLLVGFKGSFMIVLRNSFRTINRSNKRSPAAEKGSRTKFEAIGADMLIQMCMSSESHMRMSIFNYHMCVKSILLAVDFIFRVFSWQSTAERLAAFSCVLSQLKQFNISSRSEVTLNRSWVGFSRQCVDRHYRLLPGGNMLILPTNIPSLFWFTLRRQEEEIG